MKYQVDVLNDKLKSKGFQAQKFETLTAAEDYAIKMMNSMKWRWCRSEHDSVMWEGSISVFEYSRYPDDRPGFNNVFVRIINGNKPEQV